MSETDSETTSIGLYFQDVDDGPLLTREQEIELAKAVDPARWRYPNDPNDSIYRKDDDPENPENLGKIKFDLKKVGKVSFSKIWAEGTNPVILRKAKRSREKMITANLRLVARIAKRYQNRGCDLEDLIQEGNLGLIRGIDGYDYTKVHTDENTGKTTNIKLSTYCTNWIHQRINRLIQNRSRTVRIPVHVQTLSAKVQKITDEYTSKDGSTPTVNQLLTRVNNDINPMLC